MRSPWGRSGALFGPGAPGAGARPAPVGAGAAVLITLMSEDERGSDSPASVVLIRRAAHLRANPGEIAFPGGRIETGEVPLAAALREAEEEVALGADSLDVLGELSSLGHPLRSAPIVPFVAAARSLPFPRGEPRRGRLCPVRAACRARRPRLLLAGALGPGRGPGSYDALLRLGRGRHLGRDRRDAPRFVPAPLGRRVSLPARLSRPFFSPECAGRRGGRPGGRRRPAVRWTTAVR